MIVITGGGSGIGRALAFSLAKREQTLLIVGRNQKSLKETAAYAPNIHFICADLSTVAGLESVVDHLKNVGHISALVNNAGTLEPLALLKDIDPKDWHHALNINLNTALCLPKMLYSKLTQGRVLNISSGAAYFAIKGWGAYCVSKAGLSMLTKCWQLETEDIAFASVLPGITDTPMQAIARSDLNPDRDQGHFYQRLHQQNRLISAETVAEFLTWLLLDVDKKTYVSQEWDIYDTRHHQAWLKAPHEVPHWDIS